MLDNIESLVRTGYEEEVEEIQSLIGDFQAVFYQDPVIINVYRHELTQ